MYKRISFIVIVAITAGNISATELDQKTEDFGYYEINKAADAVVASPPSVREDNTPSISSNEKNTSIENAEINVTKPKVNKVHKSKVAVDHSQFDKILMTYVSDSGKVDYAGIKADVTLLDDYLSYLSQNVPVAGTRSEESLAFWINTYNANTIKLIVDNYPVNSIMDLYGGKAFEEKWIRMGGEKLSLNDIENTKIRAVYNEPRIHFAVNCAAMSCPPLLNKAWTASTMESRLEERTKSFINDRNYNSIEKGSISISKIFTWYAKDFPDNIIVFLNRYSKIKIDEDANVSYKEYDWKLNKK